MENTSAGPAALPQSFEQLVERARGLIVPGERRLLGITGAPGAGKSTVAAALADALGRDAAVVPMDGFHLANSVLHDLQRRDRKGAPDTFDPAGYISLLTRLRESKEPTTYAPVFDRVLDESIGSALAVPSSVPLVVTEGNYLLARSDGWAPVRNLLDEVWFLQLPEPVRQHRLTLRHEETGKSPEEARNWALGSDQRNAEVVAASRAGADLVVELLEQDRIETSAEEY